MLILSLGPSTVAHLCAAFFGLGLRQAVLAFGEALQLSARRSCRTTRAESGSTAYAPSLKQ